MTRRIPDDLRFPLKGEPAAGEPPPWDAAYGALPGGEETFEAPSRESVDPPPAESAAKRPPCVLVVDDEELILSSIARVLGRCGYEVVACSRPDEALERFLAEPRRFGAVISDYRMPVMNGIQLSARMIAQRPDVSILIVSGYTGEIDEGFVKVLGIRGVLTKPVSAGQLTAAVARIVPAPRRARAS